ncbi:MAG: hypothetical protein V9G29_04460 [Burkholderiaceae bacterium]
MPGLPLGTRGGVLIPKVFSREGDYEVQIRLQRDRNEQVEGMNGEHELQILVNREVKAEFTVKPAKDKNYEKIDAHLEAAAAPSRRTAGRWRDLLAPKDRPCWSDCGSHTRPALTCIAIRGCRLRFIR